MTVTETNMAYRTADHKRWQNLEFVKGFEVKLSGSHPATDICDSLKGPYPKTFLFTGWHPQCLCHAVAIQMDMEEFGKYQQAILDGTDEEFLKGVRGVSEVPEGFNNWVTENAERSKGWKSQPYFIKDNYIAGDLNQGLKPFYPSKKVAESLAKYESFDSVKWEKIYFNKDKGGFVVAEIERIAFANRNKNELAKYEKEAAMCMVFAINGHEMEHLKEIPGISSPDVRIDGILADLKRTKSHNNLLSDAKYAIYNQGAEKVLIQLDNSNSRISAAISDIRKENISGYFFYTGSENNIIPL